MMGNFYDFFANEKETIHLKHRLHYYQNILRYMYANEFLNNGDVLEVGCGSGFQIPHIIKSFRSYTGLDMSKNSLLLFKKKYIKDIHNIKIVYGSGIDFPFKPEEFDVVLCMDVIEHVPEERRTDLLRNMRNSLKQDGKLIISAPNFLSSFGLVRKIIEIFSNWQAFSDLNPDIDDWYTPWKLKDLLTTNGFIVNESIGSFYFPPYFSGKRYFLPNMNIFVHVCSYLEKIFSKNYIFKNFGYTMIYVCEKTKKV